MVELLNLVRADALERYSTDMRDRRVDSAADALQTVVESVLPRPPTPHQRVRHGPGMTSRHRTWRWVGATGTYQMSAEILKDASAVVFTVKHRGVGGRTTTLYRNAATDANSVVPVVQQAVRLLGQQGGFNERDR